MTATPPPLTPRRWAAGLLELTGDLIQQVGYVLAHVGDGIEAIADHLDPGPHPPMPDADGKPARAGWVRVIDGDHIHYVPLGDSIDHDRSEYCPCGPAARLQMTGRGDVWHIGHHRLAPDTTSTEETR